MMTAMLSPRLTRRGGGLGRIAGRRSSPRQLPGHSPIWLCARQTPRARMTWTFLRESASIIHVKIIPTVAQFVPGTSLALLTLCCPLRWSALRRSGAHGAGLKNSPAGTSNLE